MTEETTTEQLAEIEGQAEDTPATGYTPPEGWRVLQVGERLRDGDVTVCRDGSQHPADRLGGWVGSNQRYIRAIEPEPELEPQPEPEPQLEPVQVCEGRWRTRRGDIKTIRPCEPLQGAYFVWPWTDGIMTFQDNGRHQGSQESAHDLVEYLGPIEENPQPQPEHSGFEGKILCEQTQPKQVNDWPSVRQLQDELKTLQTQLGESRQRVTQLEELVASLRTINAAQEKTIRAAGQQNTDLQHRLDVVSKEWADQAATSNGLQQQVEHQQQEYERQKSRIEFLETLNAGNGAAIGDYIAKVAKLQSLVDTARQQLEASATECDSVTTRLEAVAAKRDEQAETIRKLQIELDAAQQVPQAVSDRFEEGWDAGTSQAVETIAEWTEPFRRCGSERLALAVMQNLPHIMRTLTGLAEED